MLRLWKSCSYPQTTLLSGKRSAARRRLPGMHLELTVGTADGDHDVAITAPSTATVADVAAELTRVVNLRSAVRLWSGDRALAPTDDLAGAGLCTGSVVSTNARAERPAATGVMSVQVVAGPSAGSAVPLGRGRLTIGRDQSCDLTLADPDVSRRHAAIDATSTSLTLRDLLSTNGTSIDGAPVSPAGSPVRPGCLISVGDSLLTVAGPEQTPATLQHATDGRRIVLRPPRRRARIADVEILRPTRAASIRPRGVQWIAVCLPAAAGLTLAWLMHAPQFLLFALLSPIMMLSTALADRVHGRRTRRRENRTFRRRCADADLRIAEALSDEACARRYATPDPATVRHIASLPGSRLWERRLDDPDVLRLRLGAARLPSSARVRTGSTVQPAGQLAAVPLCVDLGDGPLGIAGPQTVTSALTRWLVGQLAALHSPIDVQIALLLSPGAVDDWKWARWLPHLGARVATTGDGCARLVADLAGATDQRAHTRRFDGGERNGPWIVVVVDRAARLADTPGLAALVARGSAVGLSAIFVDVDVAGLPIACASVCRVDGLGTRLRLRTQNHSDEKSAIIDQVSFAWAEDLARSLAPLTDAGADGAAALPDVCPLLEVLAVDDLDPSGIERRWAASAGGASTAVGLTSDGRLEVDLDRDGPHALVAGTTGAGKSDLLQALVAGLATNHPPDEINFLLIDYKGGAAFGACSSLPHTAGLVTDLDAYLTERALRSLHSELRRRERLFAEVGATDLRSYTASAPDESIARLVIVVDEFASLAAELPEFVRGLVGVAQRGRSLGVHLILATQRPGTAVSADIRANTSLRIALRVTDPSESMDVIDSPDAASIERRHPGRGYLRSGSTLLCFQGAHPGGNSTLDPSAIRVELLDGWRRRIGSTREQAATSDLTRLVEALRTAAGRTGRAVARSPWLPPLPDSLPRTQLDSTAPAWRIPLAHVDLPDEQQRTVLAIDLAAGSSLLVSGTGRSGRTGVLTSLAVGATAELDARALHLHIVDATGDLSASLAMLPHCATVLGPDDLNLTPRLLERLEQRCTESLAGAGSGGETTRTLLLVDGWETLLAGLGDHDATRCSDLLANLLRIGPAAGLTIAVTGDRSTLIPRFANGFASRILLRLADRADYALAGIAARAVPATMPPGRGLRAADGAVLQVAHAGAAPTGEDLQRAVAGIAQRWEATGARGGGRRAITIRPLPTRIALAELPQLSGRLSIGLAGDQLATLSVDPFGGAGRVLVAGPPRSGRTTLLRLLARQAAAAGIATIVAAAARSALAAEARALALPIIAPSDTDVADAPPQPTLLLVDDSETFSDTAAGERLTSWVRSADCPLAAVVAGRADELATTYRGLAAEVRRSHCGILLRPGPIDGELLGIRLPRRPSSGPPGRGIAVGDASWGPIFDAGEPVPVQVAVP